jgi:hypothetical protein
MGERLLGDNHPGSMGGGMATNALETTGVIHQLAHSLITMIQLT